MSNMRYAIGDRFFVPAGPPVTLGSRRSRGLGSLVWPKRGMQETTDATILVGRDRGDQPKNRSGRCAKFPAEFRAAEADAEFARLRAKQIGAGWGASRQAMRGWFADKPKGENSLSYRIIFQKSAKERTVAQFKRNMQALAEDMSRLFCQDQVIVQVQTGKGRRLSAGYTWDPAETPKVKKRVRKR